MAAIPLSQANRAYITLNPPWGRRLFKIGRLAWAPGEMPPQLARFANDSTFRMTQLRKAQAIVQAHKIGGGKSRGRR